MRRTALLLFLLLPALSGEEAGNLDVHLHLNPARRNGRKDWDPAAAELLARMDRLGVAKALLMPPPRTSDNQDPGELDALLGLARKHAGRLYAAGGGDVLNPLLHGTPADAVTPEIRKRFEEEAGKLAASGVRAFGEMAALHLSFRGDHPFEQSPPDHPLLLLLADLAAKHGIPIDLHMEAVGADRPLPKGFPGREGALLKANIPALERLLAHNRKASIVWQHVGWDNTGEMTPGLLERLLKAHPNLHMALRVEGRPLALDGSPMPNRIVDREGRVQPGFLRLFEAFPDRFVVGSDEFVGAPGAPRRGPPSLEETWALLKGLPGPLALRIGRENAERLYRLE